MRSPTPGVSLVKRLIRKAVLHSTFFEETGALHFHESSIFAFLLFRHRPLLQFRGLGHARLGSGFGPETPVISG